MAMKAVAEAIATQGRDWVLKPQREGGGNNLYHTRLASFLANNNTNSNNNGYVLMRRLHPPVQRRAVFYKFGAASVGAAISELGVFGSYLGCGDDASDASDVTINGKYLGYLLRTKGAEVDEGGVATGFAVLNALYLVDNDR